jgi:hypothetical protein
MTRACFLVALLLAAPASAQVPNYKTFAQNLAKEGYNLTTHAGDVCFTQELAYRLNRTVDNRIRHLRKRPGQNHGVDSAGNLHAVDAILFWPTGQSIDVIGNSATAKASVAWIVDIPRYMESDSLIPVSGCPVTGPPPPDPPPTPEPPPFDPAPILSKLAALEAEVAQVKHALGQTEARLTDRLTAEEAARTEADRVATDEIAVLKARPVVTGCAVQFGLRCRVVTTP